MHYLLADECDAWLREHGAQRSPYSHPLGLGVGYIRFEGIEHPDLPSAILTSVMDRSQADVVVQVTDWSSTREYMPSALSELASFRTPASTFERRGILFEPLERQSLEDTLSAVINGAMSAYVHAPHARACLYAWEGACLEGWFHDAAILERVVQAGVSKDAKLTCRSDA